MIQEKISIKLHLLKSSSKDNAQKSDEYVYDTQRARHDFSLLRFWLWPDHDDCVEFRILHKIGGRAIAKKHMQTS